MVHTVTLTDTELAQVTMLVADKRNELQEALKVERERLKQDDHRPADKLKSRQQEVALWDGLLQKLLNAAHENVAE